ncbi:MAG: hypothetical protein JO348_09470, partial [Alphaproteobacteria bacterium]|nr:hypothetical protein [Alphaproteobacteria bacterium]
MQIVITHARGLRRILAACVLACAAATPALAADSVSVTTSAGYARMLFTFTPRTAVHATAVGGVLTLSFDRKTGVSAPMLAQYLTAYAGGARTDAGGRTYRFALGAPVRIHTSAVGNQVAVDLIPASFAGTPPDLPPLPPPPPKTLDVGALAMVAMRSGSYQNFTRLVFDWPREVKYAVFPGVGKLGIRFEALARVDVSSIARFAPPWVKNASWRVDGKGTIVEFDTDAASGFHDFRDGAKVVLDVLAPKTDADSYHPPGINKPTVTALNGKPGATAPAPTTSAVSSAQAAEIAATAAKLHDAVHPAPPAPPPPPPESKPAEAPQTPTPPADDANGQLTRGGAVLTFTGAANRGSAVFMRGLTAWVVLQNAPALDVAKLKSALRDFPIAVEAASQDGVSVLRVTLKSQAQIAARADGSTLRVTIGPQVQTNAVSITFSRNQDDPTHSSLSTLLPGAVRAVTVTDPVAGDQLVIVPTIVGRAMLAPHDYVEFGVLQTASGLVVTPYVDDLSVKVDHTSVIITHAGGLALTPPTMPLAETPGAVASYGGSAAFLDFARWGEMKGGGFLATERRLRAATARLTPHAAVHAELALARFYLANEFAAEALGLIKLMQAQNPALQSDRQLQTMRAAANYMMGRYHDAHNDIAAASFDNDRHAAFWRGLIAAALENWKEANDALQQAEPVRGAYTNELQARFRIARAQAGLGIGHLEIADAAIGRMPSGLSKTLQVDADLVKARLFAVEGRGHDAAVLFDGVEKTGGPRQQAESIYYRIEAALSAEVMGQDAA